ncbi:MAG TPA: GNAT family N-acetyltransferase [Ornithinibacter sp.]|nr:GNAT family N-acetyltransferase [Ornithinibacter sp.]
MSTLAWQPLTENDLDALRHLARRCLEADGGLPQLAHEQMVRRLFLSGSGIAGRDETGDIVAAASVFVDAAGHRTATGLVHPSTRWQGLGEELVQWAQERAGGVPLRVVAETTSPESDRLFAEHGLQRTFAEYVMRHDLDEIPKVQRPAGLTVEPWTDETAGLFFTAYRLSFAERPGFPDPPRDDWVREVSGEPGFRPKTSRVALDADGEPVGFVTITEDWIDQVGVVPAWRGRGLGAHLVVRSLRALVKAGCDQSWLAVNVDNPAHELYLRLGFEDHGVRARYTQIAVSPPA